AIRQTCQKAASYLRVHCKRKVFSFAVSKVGEKACTAESNLPQGSKIFSGRSSMLPYATLFELEMRSIAEMSRAQLTEAIWDRLDCLPADMREGLEDETTDHLQLLLLAARFVRALRHMRKHKPLGSQRTH